MAHVVIDIEAEEEEKNPSAWCAWSPSAHGMGGGVPVRPPAGRSASAAQPASASSTTTSDAASVGHTYCSTVVVTKANRASGQRGFPFLWPPPPAFASEVLLVGHYYWYHRGMGAYFDDVYQYQEMKKVCTTSPSSDESRAAGATLVNYVGYPDALFPQPAASVNVNLNVSVSPRQAADAPLEEPSSSDVGTSLVCIAVVLPQLTTGVFLMVAEHPYPKVLIVVLVSVLFSAFTSCTIYAWRKFSNNSLQWGWMN
ncbi:unnamed protein product [Miscanthus lutarioriparius]|uniref:Uncharacterized protein n=1 Tax=Miscanthus lutarioriparius TaxID=422564 RepID=A0A811RB61_9POAL|nr:unnamed protein product [Miscanthus lutarioriparius]